MESRVVVAEGSFRDDTCQSFFSLVSAFVELTKPRITLMVVLTAAVGSLLAAAGTLNVLLLVNTLLGTALLASGTSALNQYMERDADAKMLRTLRRPLPAGRLAPHHAFRFGLVLIALGTIYLAATTNFLTAFLGWLTTTTYLILYTPLKRRTHWCTLVGAIPGAVPPLMGWAAVRNGLDIQALLLFLILFTWQFPHFTAIAWIYREDYQRGGFRMLPISGPASERVVRQVILFSALLLLLSLLPTVLGLTGSTYLPGAVLLFLLLAGPVWSLAANPSKVAARRLLRASVIYLPLLLILMVLTRV